MIVTMIKFTVRREGQLILDHVHGAFKDRSEIVLQNKFSGRDFAMVIQPGDIISWSSNGSTHGRALVSRVLPVLNSDTPTVGRGARIILEIPEGETDQRSIIL